MMLVNSFSESISILGSVIDVNSGEWIGQLSGLGAGIDSFFEYLLKVILRLEHNSASIHRSFLQNYILFGDESDLHMFDDAYQSVTQYLRRGFVCSSLSSTHSLLTMF